MPSVTAPQLEKAVDMALDELNQVAFRGAPRLAVINPCRGRTDLTAIALRRISARLNEADFQSQTLVIHSGVLTHELGQGLSPSDIAVPTVRTAAESVINGIAAWALRHAGQRHGFTHDLHRLRSQYHLPMSGPAPTTPTGESNVTTLGALDTARRRHPA